MSEIELELKFRIPDDQVASLRKELQRHGARPVRLVASYYDTADGLLARHKTSLRVRKEGRRWMQTLKAEGDSTVHRLEHNVPLRAAAGAAPALDVARHDGSDAGAALRKVLAGDGAAAEVVERFGTDVSRLVCALVLPDGVVEAALDRGTIRAGDRSVPLCELELEHKSGRPQALFALAGAWRAHGGWWLDTRSKALRGGLLFDGREYGAPLKARAPRFDGQPDGAALLRAVLRSVLDQVLGNASELAAGCSSAEHVHQLRVGLRRLRTALRELAPLGQGIDARWETQLSSTFTRLGELRDDETVAQAVRPLLEQAGAPKLAWRMPATRDDPGAIVRDAAFQATLLELLAFALCADDGAGAPPAVTHEQALEQVTKRLSTLHKQVVAGGKAFGTLPLADQHRVRKRLKRLRYLAEFVQPLWDGKPARRYLKCLGPAQDALGAHNDVAVAGGKFRHDAAQDADAWFAAGWLQAHLAETARAAQAALAPLADAPRFWKRER